jgi:hypothetical protein
MTAAFVPPVRRKEGISFGRPTHWYIDGNGARIPGVTTIIGDGVPKPALIKWGMNTTAAYAVDHWDTLAGLPVSERLTTLKGAAYAERDAAGKRGTEVHDLAEKLLHGQEVPVPDELAGHVEAYVRFLDQWDPTVVLSESTVYNLTIGYAGTLDLVVDMPGGRWLLDIKTTRSGVYGDNALQLAAYRYAEHWIDVDTAHPMPEVDRCGIVWVRGDGYEVVPVEAGPDVFTEFRYVKRVARWQKDVSRTVVGEALNLADLTGQAALL